MEKRKRTCIATTGLFLSLSLSLSPFLGFSLLPQPAQRRRGSRRKVKEGKEREEQKGSRPVAVRNTNSTEKKKSWKQERDQHGKRNHPTPTPTPTPIVITSSSPSPPKRESVCRRPSQIRFLSPQIIRMSRLPGFIIIQVGR